MELVISKHKAFNSLWPVLRQAPNGQALSEKKPLMFPGLFLGPPNPSVNFCCPGEHVLWVDLRNGNLPGEPLQSDDPVFLAGNRAHCSLRLIS